ncbi:16752_t:CDS:2 [Funneliformis mosseae]|uniref:16752_t:CDS:1 n=1 Tax=Funneliformis mosseae TaxID=27381 RepID=A0A9N9D3S9_FUNMO|nr:16752_t:CDS:2 [Funneliformis mosseae]
MYGDTYLDPEKCKAREHLRKKKKGSICLWNGLKEQQKKKDFAFNSRNGLTKQFVNKDPKSLVYFNDLDNSPKKGNKSKKLSKKKIRSLLSKASHFVDCKVKLDDGVCVKVIKVNSTKMNKDSVFLEVEEKVGDELEYYEIMCQQDMIRL